MKTADIKPWVMAAMLVSTLYPALVKAQNVSAEGLRSVVEAGVTPKQAELPAPYKTVGPIPRDAHTVRYFFLFSCSYCSQYHDKVSAWAKTLPKEIRFDWMPIVVDQNSANMAAAFAAAKLAGPDKLDAFMRDAYRTVQSGAPVNQAKTWEGVAQRAGIKNYRAALNRVPDAFAGQLASFQQQFELDRTPAMVVGGMYQITPDSVNGNDKLFMTLANALVSKVLIETPKAAGK